MFEIDTITTDSGAEITVCQPHHLELCHRCCMDFIEMNNMAKSEADMKKAADQHEDGDDLDPGQLRVGTEVRLAAKRPLDGRIVGVTDDRDEESDFYGDLCYVIRLRDDNSLMKYPVVQVHQEWQLKIDGRYVAASSVFKVLSN